MFAVLILAQANEQTTHMILWIIAAVLVIAVVVALVRGSVFAGIALIMRRSW